MSIAFKDYTLNSSLGLGTRQLALRLVTGWRRLICHQITRERERERERVSEAADADSPASSQLFSDPWEHQLAMHISMAVGTPVARLRSN